MSQRTAGLYQLTQIPAMYEAFSVRSADAVIGQWSMPRSPSRPTSTDTQVDVLLAVIPFLFLFPPGVPPRTYVFRSATSKAMTWRGVFTKLHHFRSGTGTEKILAFFAPAPERIWIFRLARCFYKT